MTSNQNNNQQSKYKKPGNFAEALLEIGGSRLSSQKKEVQTQQREVEQLRKRAHQERHKEVISTQVFSRENQEVKQKIEQIQEELKALAQELAEIGTSIDKAIHEEIVNPGAYHVTFFEMIRRHLSQLKKKASESKNWLVISQQRKQGQDHYWGNVKKSGTSYMLSSERTLATQAG